MLVAMSKVTNQGQISIPAQIRRELGIKPGSVLIWDRNGNGEYTVRPKRLSLADLHQMVGLPSVHLSDLEIREARQDFLASRTKRLDLLGGSLDQEVGGPGGPLPGYISESKKD